ncbi:MAG TPA: glycosyltransferase, partial [Pyrinomonadaceae bacterium]|nr:glycosyltransferase [Pyrinomonadaceae bacterium]
MHVLLLGPYPPPQGGVQRNMLAIRDQLCRAGHRCSIINITRSARSCADDGGETNVYHPQTPLALVRLLLKLKYDLLHIHIGGNIPLRVLGLLAVCALAARGKSVLTLHSGGYPSSKEGRAARKFSLRGFIFRLYERLVCVNREQVEMFEKFGAAREKVRLIYPFFNQNPNENVRVPAHLKDFAAAHKPFLLTVGLLQPAYNLPLQIEALQKIREKFPRAGLMILGAGDLEDDLRRIIAAKSYAEHILLAGDVQHAVTLHLINDCDVLLRTTDYDGDAISVREALHLDTPVIATDNGMRPEGVRLIAPGDRAALEKAIESTLPAATEQVEKIKSARKPDDYGNIAAILNLYEEVRGGA